MAVTLGQGSLLAKLEIKSAYRMVPVSPQDQHLLGLEWRGMVFCDQALPFGLRSVPIIFTAVADGLAWALHCNGLHSFMHYLDDFLFYVPPTSQICAGALEVAVPLCARLGLPVAPSKVEGPSATITFLGIEIDMVHQVLRLPQAKLSRLQEPLHEWTERSNVTKCQLQSIIGQLNHAAGLATLDYEVVQDSFTQGSAELPVQVRLSVVVSVPAGLEWDSILPYLPEGEYSFL